MPNRLCVAALVPLSFAAFDVAQAQRRANPATATPTPTTALPTPDNKNVTVAALYLQREAVRRAAAAAPAASRARRGILGGLEKTVQGDKKEIEAAKVVLNTNAQSLVQDGVTTVVVVIGAEDDLIKVVESLSEVERPVRVAYVDRGYEDATYDNTALNSGMISSVRDAADNMWVYLPRPGAQRSKADKVLSTKVATATFWNGLFAAEGDAVNVDQLKTLVASDSSESDTPDAAAAPASTAGGSAALAVGDVAAPRIANVKVLADAAADSKVLGTLAKSDEVVIAGAAKNGFILVEGATVKGWVSVNLLSKK